MQDDQPLDQFISVEELCIVIGLKRTAVYTLIKNGELKPIKLGQRSVFSRSYIRSWMEAKVTASQEAIL